MDVRVSDDPGRAAARWIARRLADASRRRGSAALALSGGSTTPPMLAALVDPDVAGQVVWERVGVWQVDERVAPDGDPARNAGQLAVFDALPCRVRPMPVTAGDLRAAARRYAAGLPERFDVVHLGVGDDGHTASWPPGRPDIVRSTRPVELVDELHGMPRMTLTGHIVNAARARAVLTTGKAKRSIVTRWLDGDDELPIGAVHRTNTWVFLDPAAAPAERSRSWH
jgi:6-phosphogluconolactonase/glucosamine-6-phosphate isomerase/deaminase